MNKERLLERWLRLRQELDAAHVRLLAVSKYAPDAAVECLLEAGQLDFAESRAQSLRDRARRFPAARWHMIGPLQKNKAKYIARHAAMWHSVEDPDTAMTVAAHVEGRRLPVLVQVNVAGVPHQHGVPPEQAPVLFECLSRIPGLEVRGLMCMAPKEGDARACFRALRILRDRCLHGSLRPPREDESGTNDFELSMGMSGDWRLAVAEGATMVRLGSILFGMEGT